jgi:two-component system, chemotaxis family, sensor kinase CheA
MDDFEKELKLGFLQEAQQLLADTEQCFLQLESDANNPSILEQIFRLAHNFKGSSKAVGFDEMGAFTHEFESLLLKIKNGELTQTTASLNLLLRCNDHLRMMVETLTGDLDASIDSQELTELIKLAQQGKLPDAGAADSPPEEAPVEEPPFALPDDSALLAAAEAHFPEEPEAPAVMAAAVPEAHSEEIINEAPPPASEPIDPLQAAFDAAAAEFAASINAEARAKVEGVPQQILKESDLSDLLAQETTRSIEQPPVAPEAMMSSDPVPAPKVEAVSKVEAAPALQAAPKPEEHKAPEAPVAKAEAKPKSGAPAGGAVDDSIRVSLTRLEKLLNFVGEMVILQSVLREQAQSLQALQVRKTVHQLGKVTKEVQDISMSLRMVPVKQTFQKMQRIVRDTAQVLGKKVTLHLQGEDTELDKTVLEHLGDPLVHIIRNAVDHGIESAEKRKEKGKIDGGNVYLSSYHQGGKLVIEVKDDGGGINTQVLTQKAIEKGILKPGTVLPEKDAVNLIFHAGFSTKAQVTEVSGRGVGMDVVKTNIEKLSGEIQITTVLGEGTTFKVFLPLTLAIIDGMTVKCGNDRFVLPLAHVHETLKPEEADIQFATGLGEILILRGENLPLFRLDKLLNQKPDPKKKQNEGIAVVVRATEKPFAVFVDDIIGQNQIVIKKLGLELSNLRGFGGSAILGDGRPSLILELPELIQKNQSTSKSEVRRSA